MLRVLLLKYSPSNCFYRSANWSMCKEPLLYILWLITTMFVALPCCVTISFISQAREIIPVVWVFAFSKTNFHTVGHTAVVRHKHSLNARYSIRVIWIVPWPSWGWSHVWCICCSHSDLLCSSASLTTGGSHGLLDLLEWDVVYNNATSHNRPAAPHKCKSIVYRSLYT